MRNNWLNQQHSPQGLQDVRLIVYSYRACRVKVPQSSLDFNFKIVYRGLFMKYNVKPHFALNVYVSFLLLTWMEGCFNSLIILAFQDPPIYFFNLLILGSTV